MPNILLSHPPPRLFRKHNDNAANANHCTNISVQANLVELIMLTKHDKKTYLVMNSNNRITLLNLLTIKKRKHSQALKHTSPSKLYHSATVYCSIFALFFLFTALFNNLFIHSTGLPIFATNNFNKYENKNEITNTIIN